MPLTLHAQRHLTELSGTLEVSRRQREPAGRSPAQSAAKAERSECRGREDYG